MPPVRRRRLGVGYALQDKRMNGHVAGKQVPTPIPEEDDVTTARDIMTRDATCAKADETLADAARIMRDLDVGALPICGEDDRLKGMITDRDIVVKCVAEGGDPRTVKVG